MTNAKKRINGMLLCFPTTFLLTILITFCSPYSFLIGNPLVSEIMSSDLDVEMMESDGAATDVVPQSTLHRGGLGVLIGSSKSTDYCQKLVKNGPWTIHRLENDHRKVHNLRKKLHGSGLYGRISVEYWDRPELPYADNLVNLVIIDKNALNGLRVNPAELLRILAPGGAAFIEADNRVFWFEKKRHPGMAEWTHPWHDSSGNLASGDTKLGSPNAFQWLSGPPFPLRSRKSSTGVMLSAGGRIFQITQNVPENLPNSGGETVDYLVARDAFNGMLLWSRPWEGPGIGRASEGYDEAVVTDGRFIYGSRGGEIAVFDAGTGDVKDSWPVGGEPNKLILSEGKLIVQTADFLAAFDADNNGEKIWHQQIDQLRHTVAQAGRVHCLAGTRNEGGDWQHELAAFDISSGSELWRRNVEARGNPRTTALRINFAGEGVVSLLKRMELRTFCAETGEKLWKRYSQAEARGGHDSRQVGHFLAGGKFWMRADRARGGRDIFEPWLALDPRSGEMIRKIDVQGLIAPTRNVNKISCQPVTATERLVLESRLSTAWDLETGRRSGFKFIRGGCMIGMIPANGLGYVPPNACGCLEEDMDGNIAVVHSDDRGLYTEEAGPLEPGPAYNEFVDNDKFNSHHSWPTYRGNIMRGAYIPAEIPKDFNKAWHISIDHVKGEDGGEWELKFGRILTPPVAAGGMVLVGIPQTHRILAIDKINGEKLWSFTAGGRVSVPPTYHEGLVLFGAHDGYVYCLNADDGTLVWRRRMAPSDRRITAYGQLESAWPVQGGVLMHDDIAIAAAGRAVDAGGGAIVHAMDPQSGELYWSTRVKSARHGKPDLLVSDGEDVYLMNSRLDPRTGEVSEVTFGVKMIEREWKGAIVPRVAYPDGVRYLRSGQSGFMQTSWINHAAGLRMHQSSWTWGESEGELLAFDDATGFAFQIDAGRNMRRGPRTNGGGRVEARRTGEEKPDWLHKISAPAQVEAIAAGVDHILVAGPMERGVSGSKGFLRVINRQNGGKISDDISLPAPPVHDGIAMAGERVILVMKDGSVLCLQGAK